MLSACLKSSVSTIERRYGFTSQKMGILVAFNEVGNVMLIAFVSFLGSRVHRPRFIGAGGLLASVSALIIALPHFLSGPYQYSTTAHSATSNTTSGLCLPQSSVVAALSNESCRHGEGGAPRGVFPVLLLGQLLLGASTVPIQPFGMSYVDDFASRRNSPFYIDPMQLDPKDLRWVGAWWLGFLITSCILFLTSLPYLFFPRSMDKEGVSSAKESKSEDEKQPVQTVALSQFLRSFPKIALRTLRNPVFLLLCLAQVCFAAVIVGVLTFLASLVHMPLGVVAIFVGGAAMRRLDLSLLGAVKWCTLAMLLTLLCATPLLFIGCRTQHVADVFPPSSNGSMMPCSSRCRCPGDVFNPVCASDATEFTSPCHAGCIAMETDGSNRVQNYTSCGCVGNGGRGGGGGGGSALPGTCGSRCSHLLVVFMVLCGLTSFTAGTCKAPSFSTILRSPNQRMRNSLSRQLRSVSFPKIALRTLRNPVFLLLCLAQVCFAAVIVGVLTFLANNGSMMPCSSRCRCPGDVFNPVCASDATEGGGGGGGSALPGTCGSRCSHLLVVFMVLCGLTSFTAGTCKAPSFSTILRSVPSEDKSFAVGICYMLFRLLGFLPTPVLYGAVIDRSCLLWGRKCGKKTSCQYYDLDFFRRG
ncbi:hypothetical protein CRUP_020864, partial [Coryphaenoides rupestris]